MPFFLATCDPDFESSFSKILTATRGEAQDIAQTVSDIISDVRQNGDKAVLNYTQRFDDAEATLGSLKVNAVDLADAERHLSQDIKDALLFAKKRIMSFHQRQLPKHDYYEDQERVYLGMRYTPVDAAGVYVPGGAASYPSSAVMNIIPAKIAGVARVVAVVPAPQGHLHPAILYALKICDVDEIYKIGGAQAVAALAYGTDMIKPVDKITGPGNAYVAEAKRQVFGKVGIDSIAGPSEVLVLADATANAEYVALDLLSQAEHDPLAQAILVTDSSDLAENVKQHIGEYLKTLSRKEIAAKSWQDYGVIIVTETLIEATEISNRFAPEHLELCVEDAEVIIQHIKHAGAIFIGHYTPEAIGDYVGGPNHVLPTDRTARFASGLGTLDFMKRTTLIKCDSKSLKNIGQHAVTIANAEGLEAHGLSVSKRLEHI
ncbi:MAG: histidinol dehydrogenase [Pseudomonadota bacterium]